MNFKQNVVFDNGHKRLEQIYLEKITFRILKTTKSIVVIFCLVLFIDLLKNYLQAAVFILEHVHHSEQYSTGMASIVVAKDGNSFIYMLLILFISFFVFLKASQWLI